MKTILIIEDEEKINTLIARSLKSFGFHCLQAFTGMEALRIIQSETVDLILLDIQLPDSDGFSLIKNFPDTPVIYLTARDSIADRVKGLQQGAEDYIIKPFSLDELLARIQVVLRRFQQTDKYQIAGVSIDLNRRHVELKAEPLDLTPQEFNLLAVFLKHQNIALSRQQLLDQAWGFDYQGELRTVDVHVRRLRKKLHWENVLKTVFKLGYRLEVT